MLIQRLIIPVFLALLAACQPTSHSVSNTTKPQHTQQQGKPIPLQQLEPEFLFVAAQTAIEKGELAMAAGYLDVVVAKDPYTALPRAQLAEALLKSGQAQAALPHFYALLHPASKLFEQLDDPERLRLRLLQTAAQLAVKDVTGAESTLQSVLKRHPEHVPARLQLAKIYQAERNPDGALELLVRGIKRQDDPHLRRMQAQILLQHGKLRQAQLALDAMRKLAPDDASVAILLSQFASQMRQPNRAEQGLRDFLTQHPDNLIVTKVLSSMLAGRGRIPEAALLYRQLLKRHPQQHEALLTLGLLYYQHKAYAKAEQQFAKLDDDEGKFYRAASIEAQDRDDAAKQLYHTIGNGSQMFGKAQLRLAAINLRHDQAKQALSTVRTLLKEKLLQHPEIGDAWAMLSAILLEQEQYQQVIDETAPALEESQLSPRLLFNRAVAFEHFKRYDLAEQMLREQLKLKPNDPESLNFFGYMLAEQGIRLDEAEQMVHRALGKRPDDGYFLDSLAWIYFQRGDYSKAIKIQQQALKVVSDDPVMLEHLGDMQWKQGDQQAARISWQAALATKHPQPQLIQRKIDKGI
ncbi:MAG: tetratricopeptide repeat protein [Mariprofundales bacterium]